MRGLILAAGRGRRMGAATDHGPKCTLLLRGRTLLDRQLAALRGADVDPIALVAGWRPHALYATGLRTFRNPSWQHSTMVGSLLAADPWLSASDVLASYGDIAYSAATAAALAADTHDLAIAYDPAWYALWSRRFDDPLADAETFRLDDSGLLTDIGGRPATEHEPGQYVGLLRITQRAWTVLRELARAAPPDTDLTALLRLVIHLALLPIAAVPIVGPWWEFDHPRDLLLGLDTLDELDHIAGNTRKDPLR